MPSVKSSRAANDNLKDRLIWRTREVWQSRVERDLADEDARQIAENVTGFFSVLHEWSRAETLAMANDNHEPPAVSGDRVVPHEPGLLDDGGVV
jgi:hypothetical protein